MSWHRRSWPDLAEDLPVDVLPMSNGEYVPPPATARQRAVMGLAEGETERWRRRFGMSRREFVRTSAALAIGFWAIDALSDKRFGSYALGAPTASADACDLEWAGRQGLETTANLAGELILDVQSHHVDPDGLWRVTNPAMHAFFAAVWPQSSPLSGGGEADPIANLSRYHYLKELFLDSATSAAILSAVPTAPDSNQPLPIAEAMETAGLANDLAGAPGWACTPSSCPTGDPRVAGVRREPPLVAGVRGEPPLVAGAARPGCSRRSST